MKEIITHREECYQEEKEDDRGRTEVGGEPFNWEGRIQKGLLPKVTCKLRPESENELAIPKSEARTFWAKGWAGAKAKSQERDWHLRNRKEARWPEYRESRNVWSHPRSGRDGQDRAISGQESHGKELGCYFRCYGSHWKWRVTPYTHTHTRAHVLTFPIVQSRLHKKQDWTQAGWLGPVLAWSPALLGTQRWVRLLCLVCILTFRTLAGRRNKEIDKKYSVILGAS